MPKDTIQSDNLQQDAENNLISPSNYTQIPNVVFDYWMPKLSHPTFKVLLCICRNTLGWHKSIVGLSYIQLHELTGIAISTLQISIAQLIKLNLIYLKSGANKQTNEVNLYSLKVIEIKKENDYRHSVHPYTDSRHTPIPIVGSIKRKNLKEKKEEINKEKTKSHSPSPEAQELVKIFIQCLRKNKPDIKIPDNLFKWYDCIDKLLKIDKRSFESIHRLMEWVTADTFWKGNILSPEKLRLKFDQLEIRMNSESEPKSQEINVLEQNKKIAQDILRKFPKRHKVRHVECFDSYIEFQLGGQSASILIEYSDKNFLKSVQNALLKWGNHD